MNRLHLLDEANLKPINGSASFSLRVSVLENCQYSCPYCLPGTVKPFAHKPSWLSIAEYRDIAKSLSRYPIAKVRFTGGEPLIRPNLFEIAKVFREEFPASALAITTNGQLLSKKWQGLLASGVSKLNVHIDSFKAAKYKEIMGDGDVEEILACVLQIREHFEEVKINFVLQKGINEDEICDFLAFSARTGIEVRFIELMNTGSAQNYVGKTFLEGAQAIRIIESKYSVTPAKRKHSSDAAALFSIKELGIQFGLIASDTQPFCENCNRLRLTAQGQLRGCLYEPTGVSLGSLLRGGKTQRELSDAIDKAVLGKRSFHPLVAEEKYQFSMAEIGG